MEIPRLRKGSYFPSFPEPRRTAEKARVALDRRQRARTVAFVARTDGATTATAHWRLLEPMANKVSLQAA